MSADPSSPPTVAAVVLAAGESRRFGSPKQLALLGERTLLEHVLSVALDSGLAPVLAVVPDWLPLPATTTNRVTFIRNPHQELGMSHSLKLGFAALPETVDAAVVLLADQPDLPAAVIGQLLSARGERPIVASWREGHPSPPALVEREAFALVESASGDSGLRDMLIAHPELVARVELPEIADVDTVEDLSRLRSGQ
jgi:CTP:molybdopterin cytidylyltransferase MocA